MKIPARSLSPQALESPMRQRRLAIDMTLTELSGLTGVDLGLLSRVERGQRKPTAEIAVRIARGLGVTAPALFGKLFGPGPAK